MPVRWKLADGTSIAQIIERFTLPARLVHLVLLDGAFVPPAERAGASCTMGKRWPSGRPWPADEVSAALRGDDFPRRVPPLAAGRHG
jgi:hypothetical protein